MLSLGSVFQRHYAKRDGVNAAKNLVQAVASRWFAIGDRTLQEYQDLIEDFSDDEPSFQQFFEANPQFLDPMAVEVWPEPNLFGSRKPDFVVKRSDGSYLVVEIECPSKALITKAGHPSADVTHAEHQATDYRKYMMGHDLPPEAPLFITRVCGSGFHILRRLIGQARRARSPQIAQASGALLRVFGCRAMSAA
ncbi:Shedu anti-phage system protein SduA domain-containing protein [Pseudophaeobacter sp. A-200-2]|uniref:Shedu anti-phage system protein SduA domain-containing protein n=1 Tax=Pseudophaeobacter sp. A-200-2 TaxID=3098145 RepID=UPI0034D59C7A